MAQHVMQISSHALPHYCSVLYSLWIHRGPCGKHPSMLGVHTSFLDTTKHVQEYHTLPGEYGVLFEYPHPQEFRRFGKYPAPTGPQTITRQIYTSASQWFRSPERGESRSIVIGENHHQSHSMQTQTMGLLLLPAISSYSFVEKSWLIHWLIVDT